MGFLVFGRSHAVFMDEEPVERAQVLEAGIHGDGLYGHVTVLAQKGGGIFQPQAIDVSVEIRARVFPHQPGYAVLVDKA